MLATDEGRTKRCASSPRTSITRPTRLELLELPTVLAPPIAALGDALGNGVGVELGIRVSQVWRGVRWVRIGQMKVAQSDSPQEISEEWLDRREARSGPLLGFLRRQRLRSHL